MSPAEKLDFLFIGPYLLDGESDRSDVVAFDLVCFSSIGLWFVFDCCSALVNVMTVFY